MTVHEESNIRIEKSKKDSANAIPKINGLNLAKVGLQIKPVIKKPMTEKERIFKAKMDYKLETMNFKEGAPVPEIE